MKKINFFCIAFLLFLNDARAQTLQESLVSFTDELKKLSDYLSIIRLPEKKEQEGVIPVYTYGQGTGVFDTLFGEINKDLNITIKKYKDVKDLPKAEHGIVFVYWVKGRLAQDLPLKDKLDDIFDQIKYPIFIVVAFGLDKGISTSLIFENIKNEINRDIAIDKNYCFPFWINHEYVFYKTNTEYDKNIQNMKKILSAK